MGLLQYALGLSKFKGESPKDSYSAKPRENHAYYFAKKKNGQNMAQNFRKWHKINQIGETSGERKIFPSANPGQLL